MTTTRLWKVLGHDRSCCHGGSGAWTPPGEWMPPINGEIVPCRNGYHLCRNMDLIHWLDVAIWPAEARGEILADDTKIVAREARLTGPALTTWNERSARVFACDCADRVLQHAAPEHRDALAATIATGRRYAAGMASPGELRDAAKAAATAAGEWAGAEWAASGAAVWAAVWDATAAEWAAARDASAAAEWAARAAAKAAAIAAVWAARDASGAAVWAAVWAATAAEWAAARDASAAARARARARATATAAEHAWQTARLLELLDIEPGARQD